MDVSSTLRAARRRAGLTQGALAARARTSQATISAYENGSKQPSVATLSRLLAATGSRLAVEPTGARPRPAAEPARRQPVAPSRAQLTRAGRTLVEVLGLAEALPVRHELTLRFPRLGGPATRSG